MATRSRLRRPSGTSRPFHLESAGKLARTGRNTHREQGGTVTRNQLDCPPWRRIRPKTIEHSQNSIQILKSWYELDLDDTLWEGADLPPVSISERTSGSCWMAFASSDPPQNVSCLLACARDSKRVTLRSFKLRS